ncbi:MAG: hypothetical protein ACD_45C00123G0001 [uncultured bacterium]|nr:MAG: hypothetical protein ACD_45C00123G0001 [uncultured bacterium]
MDNRHTLDELFLCPINLTPLERSILTPCCGMAFEKKTIQELLEKEDAHCPNCQKNLPHSINDFTPGGLFDQIKEAYQVIQQENHDLKNLLSSLSGQLNNEKKTDATSASFKIMQTNLQLSFAIEQAIEKQTNQLTAALFRRGYLKNRIQKNSNPKNIDTESKASDPTLQHIRSLSQQIQSARQQHQLAKNQLTEKIRILHDTIQHDAQEADIKQLCKLIDDLCEINKDYIKNSLRLKSEKETLIKKILLPYDQLITGKSAELKKLHENRMRQLKKTLDYANQDSTKKPALFGTIAPTPGLLNIRLAHYPALFYHPRIPQNASLENSHSPSAKIKCNSIL